jgi:hypothetical protein
MTKEKKRELEFEDRYDQLRLKCFKDLVELAKLDKDWNPEDFKGIET